MCAALESIFQQHSAAKIEARSLYVRPIQLPNNIDLRSSMSTVKDQGTIGSCGPNAFSIALEYLLRRRYGINVQVSRLFMYYNARHLHQTISPIADKGTYATSCAQALILYGCCEEHLWPHKKELVNVKPSREAYQAARTYTINAVKIPMNVQSIKSSLAYGFPVIVGIYLKDYPGTIARGNHGVISIPNISLNATSDSIQHIVTICGYHDSKKCFIVRNSWSRQWGDNGDFKLPYAYLSHESLAGDFDNAWVVTDINRRQQYLPKIRIAKLRGASANKESKENLQGAFN